MVSILFYLQDNDFAPKGAHSPQLITNFSSDLNLKNETAKININQGGSIEEQNAKIYYSSDTGSGLVIENLKTNGDSRSIKINSNWKLELSCFKDLMLNDFSTSLFKVVSIIRVGDNGNYFVENNLPIASFYITELNNDVRIFLRNSVTGSSFKIMELIYMLEQKTENSMSIWNI